MQDNKAKLIGLVVIALLAIGGTGAVVVLNKQDSGQSSEATTTKQQTPVTETDSAASNSSTTATTNTYKDGEYSADGTYRTPGGNETISVDITLKDNTVTAVSVEGNGTGDSAEYQAMFKKGIASQVVGKKIDELNVSRVSGSSLTSTGFNNALDTIKQQAQA